jgi:small subunit ribosomal protein S8
MLTRIRNAIAVRKNEVSMPHSKLKEAVARMLQTHNFIDGVRVEGEGKEKSLTLTLHGTYDSARITEIAMVSTPGRRMYAGAKEMPNIKHGRGIVIVSTSNGLMTGDEAKAKGIGGELICKVY